MPKKREADPVGRLVELTEQVRCLTEDNARLRAEREAEGVVEEFEASGYERLTAENAGLRERIAELETLLAVARDVGKAGGGMKAS